MLVQDGRPAFVKKMVVAARQPGKGQRFSRVEMRDMQIVDHGTAAVVTCQGIYDTPQSSVTLKFMRVWVKKGDRWQIVAGSIAA